MRLGRKSSDERALAEIDEKLTAARADLAERRRLEAEAEAEREGTIADLAADLGLGAIDADAYEHAKADADRRYEYARAERERGERVERALVARAAPIARRVADARVAAAERDLAESEEAVRAAEEALARCQFERDTVVNRLAVVRRKALDLPAAYDAEVAGQAAVRRVQDAELAEWWAREWPTTFREKAPVELHDLIADRVKELTEEDERKRDGSRDAAEAQAVDVYANGLRTGAGFPRLGPSPVPRIDEPL
jgi:hypothetical protein